MNKVLVLGCGSIGQRHIRNLLSLDAGKIFAFDIDQKKLKQVQQISSAVITSHKLELLWKESPSIAFITLPNSLHIKYALEAAKNDCHLFIEKPLSHNLRNLNSLLNVVKQKKLITFVGCNMRFYWAIAKIKELLKTKPIGKIVSARIEGGQYLPDWHPWEDYRKMYSAKKSLGGGVILDGIHEIDYACWFFGEVVAVMSIYGKLSSLKIDTEDTAEILLKFKNGPLVNIHMDYIQRSYARSCKIIGDKGTIKWDFNEHSIKLYLAKTKKWKVFSEPKNYNLNQMYIDEVKYFLMCVNKRQRTLNDIFAGFQTLQISLGVKRKGLCVE